MRRPRNTGVTSQLKFGRDASNVSRNRRDTDKTQALQVSGPETDHLITMLKLRNKKSVVVLTEAQTTNDSESV
jgi:hypothetical protein